MKCRKCHSESSSYTMYQEYIKDTLTSICVDSVECYTRKNQHFIRNSEPEEIEEQLRKTPNLIQVIISLGINEEKYNMIAVKQKGSSIKYIENPSVQVQEIAISEKPENYFYIEKIDICPLLELKLFLKHPDLMKFKKEPGIALQLTMFYLDKNSIFHFKKIHNYIKSICETLHKDIYWKKIDDKYIQEYGENEPFTIFRRWDYAPCVSEDTDSEFSISDLNKF